MGKDEILKAVYKAWSDNTMGGKYYKAFKDGVRCAVNRLEQALEEQSTDAVSRAYLLNHDFIITAQNGISHRVIYATKVEEAPSVIPQIKRGQWIFNEKLGHQYCCSECGNPMPTVNDYYRAKLIGCPYCLADMIVSNDL